MQESTKIRNDRAKRFAWDDGDIVLETPGGGASIPEEPPVPTERSGDVSEPPLR